MRARARKFPALINCTVIDWFQPWPYEALMSVADSFLKDTDMGDQSIHQAVVKFMPTSFMQVN
jgi:dynein heavy chain